MSDTVIKIENLSKLYRLGEVGTGTLSHDLNRWWSTRVLGRDDPYAKVGQVNDRTQKAGENDYVWALKDINLEVKQGEILGVIGKNGAGKSTLLKLLSRVTSPTTGSIKVKGRLASLLEVGTGFHPEMTGRENIYMNGTIMGMRKWEIDKKLDEIVDFAGVAKYLDTPAKRYSSGMTVRLGFAVAAFLEPEILVVDEVLAVGDAEFQKKAIGKMQDVSQGQGRTVLFVSHNMVSMSSVCENAILLSQGIITLRNKVSSVIAEHIGAQSFKNEISIKDEISKLPHNLPFKLIGFRVFQNGKESIELNRTESIDLEFEYVLKETMSGLRLYFDLIDSHENILIRSFFDESYENFSHERKPGYYISQAKIPGNILVPNHYLLIIRASIHNGQTFTSDGLKVTLHINDNDRFERSYSANPIISKFLPKIVWQTWKK